jgi:hypothetical protein
MTHVLSQPEFGPGSGNPRDDAYQQGNQHINQHAQMLQHLTGGKKRKTRGGAEAAQFNLQYNPGGQNPNTIVTKLQETQLQSAENAKLDGALVSGGSRKKKTKTRKTKTRKRRNKRRTNRKKRR